MTRRRRRSPTGSTRRPSPTCARSGNLALDFPTDEVAFFAQDSWKLKPNFTFNYGLRWEGAFNPTPDANNDFMVSAVQNAYVPARRRSTRRRFPTRPTSGARASASRGTSPTTERRSCAATPGIYYARTPALLYASPMNNFRVPAGDLSLQLPFAVPAGNPNNTVYKQLKLIGIDLNTYSLGALPHAHLRSGRAIAAAARAQREPVLRGAADPDGRRTSRTRARRSSASASSARY